MTQWYHWHHWVMTQRFCWQLQSKPSCVVDTAKSIKFNFMYNLAMSMMPPSQNWGVLLNCSVKFEQCHWSRLVNTSALSYEKTCELYLTIFLPSSPQLPFSHRRHPPFPALSDRHPTSPKIQCADSGSCPGHVPGRQEGSVQPNRGFGSLKHWGVGLSQSHSPLPLS